MSSLRRGSETPRLLFSKGFVNLFIPHPQWTPMLLFNLPTKKKKKNIHPPGSVWTTFRSPELEWNFTSHVTFVGYLILKLSLRKNSTDTIKPRAGDIREFYDFPKGRTHKRCTLMDPHTWPCKSRTISTNIHSAAMWGYGMLSWRPA